LMVVAMKSRASIRHLYPLILVLGI